MHKIVILLGSNQGDRKSLISRAIHLIESQLGKCSMASSIYETEAWGFKSDYSFLNQVVNFKTQRSPLEILQITQGIEKQLGRIRNSDIYESRTMDIDLLFYDSQIIKENNLEIPHPRLHMRRFTLEPLAEIMPEFVHPSFKKTIQELLNSCEDKLNLKKLNN